MGFSTHSLDHLLLLKFGCTSVWCRISWMGSYRSTRAPYIPVVLTGSWWDLGQLGWQVGGCASLGLCCLLMSTTVPRAASSGMTLPKMVTRNWPPVSCFWWADRACLFPGCGHVFVCTVEGEHLQGLSRDCSSIILLETGCCQGLHTHYSCNPVHPPGGFFTPVD